MTFNAHLKASTAALRPFPWALWDIVRPMVANITKGYPSVASDKYLQTELNIIKELEALIQFTDQFFMQCEVVQSSIERRFPDFWGGLKSMQSALIARASAPSPSRFSTASGSETLVAQN